MNKKIHILGGGTVFHVRSHLAISAPAYGNTARKIDSIFYIEPHLNMDVILHLTRMANGGVGDLETNEDVSKLVDQLIADPLTKIIFMNVALCDYNATLVSDLQYLKSGKYEGRLSSRKMIEGRLQLNATEKIVGRIRKTRKDIFLVAFKTTCGATEDEQYIAGLNLCKEASANLVLANDVKTRLNMVITPEEARYHVTTNRGQALSGLVEMTLLRSHLTFTRSTVIAGTPVSWNSSEVPEALRTVVNYCIEQDAYKPFRGSTVGHFAAKISENEFLTSIRKTNFNDLSKNGLVRIKTDGPDSVTAYGAKPSVGGQSQRIVFHEHQDYDCIVHFHCPLRKDHRDDIPIASQREFECGSHQCGQNTSSNLKKFGNLSCVMLDQHGPNIIFHRSIDPQEVINFIVANFELSEKTGGYVA
jgi:hypothetical protein